MKSAASAMICLAVVAGCDRRDSKAAVPTATYRQTVSPRPPVEKGSPMTGGLERVNSIKGMHVLTGQIRRIELTGPFTEPALFELLHILKEGNQDFALYDERYPSSSDPGAYFSYSAALAGRREWRMTFGNHGWTGGIYVIDENTVVRQLQDLVSRGLLRTIDLDEVSFFSHYPLQIPPKSREMNEKLLAIHANGGPSSSQLLRPLWPPGVRP